MARNILVGGGLVLAVFAAGVFIGHVGTKPVQNGLGQVVQGRTLGDVISGNTTQEAFEQSRSFEDVRAADAPRAKPDVKDQRSFAFAQLTLDTTGEVPQACFGFTQKLDVSGSTNYADYIKFKPSAKVVAEPMGKVVCFSGLDFDKDYQATLREGLPSARRGELEKSDTVTVSFGDKPAYVGFAGNGVILPRMEADGIGFETVNVSKLKVTVRRVGDRALAYKSITEGETTAEDRYSYTYGEDDGEDVGVSLWEGVIDVTGQRNEKATSVFPLGAALGAARREATGGLQSGAYFISINDASEGVSQNRPARAWRWIMFTDMALTTYYGADGIDVVVRSLETARPLAGVEVKLIAQNNDVLTVVKSDGDGRARFAGPLTRGQGPQRPKMIMAYGVRDDFAAIDLTRSPLDLSNQNVSGRSANSELDSFIWFDRGIYRPGETTNISAMLRDQAGNAIDGRLASLEIRRPNNTLASTIRIENMEIGGFSQAYEIPLSAPRGNWTAVLKVDGRSKTWRASFSVEDFVPQRIAVTVSADQKQPVVAGQRRPVNVEARFLYGAPGSGLAVEGEARLRIDPNPFPDYADYSFGLVEGAFSQQRLRLGDTMTDGDGKATLTLAIDRGIESQGKPLRADLVVGVAEPGGRFVQESIRVPVRVDKRYLGLRKADSSAAGRNQPIDFEIVMLDQSGQPLAQEGLTWKIIEEDYRFEWYRQNDEWRWRRDYRDVLVASGSVDTDNQKPATLSQVLDYGSYRLEVMDPATDVQASYRFYAGWRSYSAGAQTPDQASLTIPEKPVKAGTRARVTLAAPYAGEVMVVIATDRIHEVQRLRLDGKPREIVIDTKEEWGGGFYVLATVVTPRDAVSQPVPRRAMGVAYVPFDMATRTFDMSFNIDKMVRPRQKIILPVTVGGAEAGEEIMMTIAAVDEGILRLTKFKTPDPVGWYFGKKSLGLKIFDDYGRLLNANLGAAANFGGDQLGGEGLTVVPTKSVSLFRGPVRVGANGEAQVPLTIPDFNGELRLMSVAWSRDKLGAVEQALTVRDKVPAELALPRFLGPNDSASTTLLIDNVEGRTGVYKVNITGTGPVSLRENANINLATGQRQDQLFTLQAGDIGIGTVDLSVSGPDNFSVQRSYPIQVRAPYFPVTRVETQAQNPGATYIAGAELAAGYLSGNIDVAVSFSPLKGIDPQPLLDSLYRYPYGCTEQLTSSSFPLLFVNQLGGVLNKDPERELRPRVQKAINRLLARQGPDGAFGLWRAGDRYTTGWIGAYVTDFLYRARAQGYFVPDEVMDEAYGAIAKLTSTDRYISVSYITRNEYGSIYAYNEEQLRRRAAAYAFYVLTRAGRADLSDLRYFHDSFISKVDSPLARAHIASALAMMGDRARATNAFRLAEDAIGYDNGKNYYQSPLRDLSAMIALAAEVENGALVDRLTDEMAPYLEQEANLNTQEKAFLLLASAALLERTGDVSIGVEGMDAAVSGKTPRFVLSQQQLTDGVRFTNDSSGPIFRSVAVNGSPKKAPPAEEEGFTLAKAITDLNGARIDLAQVRQNDRLVIAISGRADDYQLHPAIVVDMLPPGFEIETVLRPEDTGENAAFSWLAEVSRTKVSEARDDRFVAAIDLRRSKDIAGSGAFSIAYIVRAVTPGKYVLPGSVIEDMYRPGLFARTDVDKLTIVPAR